MKNVKKKRGRLFTVLVAGGVSLAAMGQDGLPPFLEGVGDDEDEECKVALHSKDYFQNPVVQCLDDMDTDEAILEAVEKARSPGCATPFCGCWLG